MQQGFTDTEISETLTEAHKDNTEPAADVWGMSVFSSELKLKKNILFLLLNRCFGIGIRWMLIGMNKVPGGK